MKWGLPAFAAIVSVWVGREKWLTDPVIPLIVMVMALVIAFVMARKQVKGLADSVHDAGDRLVVKQGRATESVSFPGISAVSKSMHGLMPVIVLQLKSPGSLGSEITFVPLRTRDQLEVDRQVAQLQARLNG